MTASQAPASRAQRRALVPRAGCQHAAFCDRPPRNCLLDRIDPGLFTMGPAEHRRLMGSRGLSAYESQGGGGGGGEGLGRGAQRGEKYNDRCTRCF